MNKIPNKGQDQQHILAQLKAFKGKDLPWQAGKIFAYIYQTTPEAKAVAEAALPFFFARKWLGPHGFPLAFAFGAADYWTASAFVGRQ